MPTTTAKALLCALPLASGLNLSPLGTTSRARSASVARSAAPRLAENLLLQETVPVPDAFFESAGGKHNLEDVAQYKEMYEKSVTDPDAFWGEIASTFTWDTPWESVRNFNFDSSQGTVFTEWFKGGKTNLCYNAVDRHVEAGKGDQVAFYHEANGEDEELPSWTYKQVQDEVSKMANALRARGVKKGDVVTLFMPMVPQLPMAMLACARIGATHSVVFGGFSAEALSNRLIDAKSTVVVAANGVMRGGKSIDLFKIVANAAKLCEDAGAPVESMIVLKRLPEDILPAALKEGRDMWWEDALGGESTEAAVEWMDSEDPSFVLYTSGSTGKPKGVTHTTGGYMVYSATTSKYIFDLQPDDVFFCTADCGWITGHSYVAYGPMFNGASQLIYEGVPSFPDAGRIWRIVDKYKVTQLYTAPTAIRSLMAAGDEPVKACSRESLRLLGSVGEPINPEAWRWYNTVVGEERCPIVDTWWQTETGGIMITPLPMKGFEQKPGCAQIPFFGVQPALIKPDGEEIEGAAEGLLAIKAAWPSTIRRVLGDYDRMVSTYFPINGYYLTGDGARRDEEGHYQITGRVDDVINVSGHRIGTAEVESAVVLHPDVAEAAAVGYPHPVKGEGIYIYVTLNNEVEGTKELQKELWMKCRQEIGAFAAPDAIQWAPALPKTRSGKIMRRILRKIAEEGKEIDKEVLGDTSTLADPSVVDQLIAGFGAD